MLEEAINLITNKLRSIGLEVLPEKTKFVQFNKQRIQPSSMVIRVKNIVSIDSVKFLGIHFDDHLSFTPTRDTYCKRLT